MELGRRPMVNGTWLDHSTEPPASLLSMPFGGRLQRIVRLPRLPVRREASRLSSQGERKGVYPDAGTLLEGSIRQLNE